MPGLDKAALPRVTGEATDLSRKQDFFAHLE
jgi:hypothetical protein